MIILPGQCKGRFRALVATKPARGDRGGKGTLTSCPTHPLNMIARSITGLGSSEKWRVTLTLRTAFHSAALFMGGGEGSSAFFSLEKSLPALDTGNAFTSLSLYVFKEAFKKKRMNERQTENDILTSSLCRGQYSIDVSALVPRAVSSSGMEVLGQIPSCTSCVKHISVRSQGR